MLIIRATYDKPWTRRRLGEVVPSPFIISRQWFPLWFDFLQFDVIVPPDACNDQRDEKILTKPLLLERKDEIEETTCHLGHIFSPTLSKIRLEV